MWRFYVKIVKVKIFSLLFFGKGLPGVDNNGIAVVHSEEIGVMAYYIYFFRLCRN